MLHGPHIDLAIALALFLIVCLRDKLCSRIAHLPVSSCARQTGYHILQNPHITCLLNLVFSNSTHAVHLLIVSKVSSTWVNQRCCALQNKTVNAAKTKLEVQSSAASLQHGHFFVDSY